MVIVALVFVPSAVAAQPLTYQTVTAREIQQASLATRSVVSMDVIAGMYAAGYTGDPTALAKDLLHWHAIAAPQTWRNVLADYHAGSVRGQITPSDIRYADSVLAAAGHVPHALAGAMSTGSALTLAAVIAGGAAAGELVGLWATADGAVAAGGGGGAAGTVAKTAFGDASGGGSPAGSPASAFSTGAMAVLRSRSARSSPIMWGRHEAGLVRGLVHGPVWPCRAVRLADRVACFDLHGSCGCVDE